jgi:hypothetical protein
MPESKAGQGPKDATKSKSPVTKSRDVITTSATTERETGSGEKRLPIPDLHMRMGLATMDPDQETIGCCNTG